MFENIYCVPGFLAAQIAVVRQCLEELREIGLTGCRLFENSAWPLRSGSEHASPYVIREWKPDTEIDLCVSADIKTGTLTPVFEHRWNDDYFEYQGSLIDRMKELGLKLHASLFDFCTWKLPGSSVYYGRAKAFNNWWQFRGEYGGGALWQENIRPLLQEWIDKIVPFIETKGIVCDYETVNELWLPLIKWEHQTLKESKAEMVKLHNWIVEKIMAHDVPLERIYFSGDETPEMIDVYSQMKRGYVCHHGISNPSRLDGIWEHASPGLLLSNDGGGNNPGNTGPWGIYGRRETGAEDAEAIVEKGRERGDRGIECLSHSCEYPGKDEGNGPWGYIKHIEAIGRMIDSVPQKYAITVCSLSGLLPREFCPETKIGKLWPWESIVEICNQHKLITVCQISGNLPVRNCPRIEKVYVVGTEPTTVCAEKKHQETCHQKYIEGRSVSKWQIGAWLKCIFGR